MSIALRGVSKQFGEYAAVENIDLDVPTGALMALLGPSGSGKTTLLRIIGGLETPDAGQVLFDGQDATLWPIGDRKVGFVFQQYALFRHMSVFKNVAFGLNVRARRERPSKEEIRARVFGLLNRGHKSDIGAKDAEKLLGFPVAATFPNDYRAVRKAISEGVFTDTRSDLGQAYLGFAKMVLGMEQEKKSSWFRK